MSNDAKKNLMVVCASLFAIIPQYSHLSNVAAGAIAFLILWRTFIIVFGRLTPSEFLLRAIAIATVITACVVQQSISVGISLDLIFTLLCVTLTLKIFELRSNRDFIFAFSLLSFLIGVDLCYSQDSETLVLCSVASLFLLLAMIMNSDRNGSLGHWRSVRVSLVALMIIVPVTACFNFAFPLDGLSRWSLMDGNSETRTGMSDSMAPGDVAELTLSDEPAFEGKFLGFVPPKAWLYWRGSVLTEFDGARWSATMNRVQSVDGRGVTDKGGVVEYDLLLEPSNGWWVPVLDSVSRITPVDADTSVFGIGNDMEVRTAPPFTKEKAFKVKSHLRYRLDADMNQADLDEYLQLPSNNTKAREYGLALARKFSSKTDIVNAMLKKIANEKFFYRLDPKKTGSSNPVDDFLFGTKEGYCEHYSSAFAVVMRSAGVPARVVTGYMGATELNESSGRFKVKQSEAHAWTEVWLDGRGWVRVDPTASIDPSRVIKKKQKSMLTKIIGGLLKFTGSASGIFRFNQKLVLESQDAEVFVGEGDVDGKERSVSAVQESRFALEVLAWILVLAGIGGAIYTLRRKLSSLDQRALLELLCRDVFRLAAVLGVRKIDSEGLREFSARIDVELDPETALAFRELLIGIESTLYGDADRSVVLKSIEAGISEISRKLTRTRRLMFIAGKASDRFLSR